MRLTQWLRSLASRTPRAPRPAAGRAKRFRPRLEELEHRYCPSGGQLDAAFGGTGTVALADHARAWADVVQPDGKIVSVGHASGGKVSVTRLNANGSPDATFNGTGSLTLSVVGGKVNSTDGSSVALQPDGKILVGATAYFSKYPDSEYVVARLNANGSLDTSFGSKGYFLYNPTAARETVHDLAVLSDGSILVGGTGATPSGQDAFAVLKLTPGGALNKAFGSGGVALVHVGANDTAGGMAVVPATGQVVLAGQAGNACLVVLTASGLPDTSFNGTGYEVYTPTATASSSFSAVAVQGDAAHGYKIVAVGRAQDSSVYGMVARFLLSGAADATFGGAGTGCSLINYSSGYGGYSSLALEADGSIIVGGPVPYNFDPATGNYQLEMAVGHLSADGVLDASFGPNGNGFSYDPTISGVGGLAIDPATGKIVACGSGSSGSAYARFTSP